MTLNTKLFLELSFLVLILTLTQSSGGDTSSERDGEGGGGGRRSGSLSPKLQSSTTAATIESLIEEVEEKEEKSKEERNGNRDNDDDNKSSTKDPKKANFQEERFSNLFNSRSRSRARLPPVRYTTRVKPTLPSFIRNTPTPRPVTFQPSYVQRTGERNNAGIQSEFNRSREQSSRSGRLSDARNGRVTTPSTTTTTKPTASPRRSRQRESVSNPVVVPISDTRSRGRFSSITPRNSTRSSLTRARNNVQRA